jgi:hypothetical protein
MNYYQLTHYMQRRFRDNRKCKLCGKLITNTEPVFYEYDSIGRRKFYNFFHRRCILNEQAKSTVKSQE